MVAVMLGEKSAKIKKIKKKKDGRVQPSQYHPLDKLGELRDRILLDNLMWLV
jgi:hypothetical protein